MTFTSAIHDPLDINLRRQARAFLSIFPSPSHYATSLLSASSNGELLVVLSELLAVPAFTLAVAAAFRPILLDLCARWLHEKENTEEQLAAICLLLEPHEELFPVVLKMLLKSPFENGPLAFITASPSPLSIDVCRMHRLLLVYYRILQANRELPRHLLWSLSPLSHLIWTPHLDNGVRLLSIRCYALQSGMGEAEREKLETEVFGEICGVDCRIEYGQAIDGTRQEVDGWVLPVIEMRRVQAARNAIVLDTHDYYTQRENDPYQPINPSELSPFIAHVHGVLLLCSSGSRPTTSPLICTPTTIQSLRSLAFHFSLRIPTLLTSPPSSGKSMLLSHLAEILHPGIKNQIINIHLADTSLDPRSLLGSYISSPTQPGTFEWKEGVLVRSMKEGKWVVFEDIDRGSSEVLGVIKPLVESLRLGKWIGGRASLDVPSRGRVIASDAFALFATRSLMPSRNGKFPNAVFFGAHKFHEIIVPSPSAEELRTIIDARFPRLAGNAAQGIIRLWASVRDLGSAASTRDVGLRELEKFCSRVERLLPFSYQSMDIVCDAAGVVTLPAIFPNPTLREDMYLEARDVFFGAGTLTASARAQVEAIAIIVAEHLGLEVDRRQWVLQGRVPDFEVEKDVNGRVTAVRVGRTRLPAGLAKKEIAPIITRPFAMHRPAVLLLSRIATALSLGEPVLLTGETGTGKTSVITHLASLLRRPLTSLNLSHQSESSDLLGGFKPVDARIPSSALQERFIELFGGTFSRRKNAKFEESVRKAVLEGKWKRVVGLWKESVRLAMGRIQARQNEEFANDASQDSTETPRKRRKLDQATLNASEASWNAFARDVDEFEVQHIHGKGKFAFGFVEGPLVKALRSGDWVLLDEINLASPETLESISSLLHGPTTSITLTEQGSLEPVPRHPDFRLFACMNPATDVGKKDLPPNIRSRFTEIDVPAPDADRETLLSIITQYIGPSAVGDKAAIMNVAEFYTAVKELAESRQIADGSNHRPHYSMRTLARALTFAADMASTYGLRRSIWEGCLMGFTMVLDAPSAEVVTALAQKYLLAGVRNPRSLLSKEPSIPHSRSAEEFVKFGPFYLERGPLPEDLVDDYIMTPSVETKLIDLARIILTRRFPVLIEGPTSSGKTSSVEYLARRTGHRFVRINNHEHTDIQEYLGSYVSDPLTGKLVFKDGLLVRALRNGDWIVLDELNLAPTDVLEALNRLLDDNRELFIPETQEVVQPHPHFMLFATQNPPGLYAGRKVLSRAFRNRFLEVHFDDVPQAELESILCQRCRIAPSYGKRIVSVFRELQNRRQSGRVFESKHGFATLRDLFRWAGRDAIGYQELAENGYMLLAERTRREDDKAAVKEVIESVMGVKIEEKVIYNLQNSSVDFASFLGCSIPTSSHLIWTNAMQRLFVLVTRALRFNEPVLLVGETGSGKTSVCQVYAEVTSKRLHGLNCHQNTETADMIGGLRPVRTRHETDAEVLREVGTTLEEIGVTNVALNAESLLSSLDSSLGSSEDLSSQSRSRLESARQKLLRLKSIFEWHDGPLIEAMRAGDVFLLDEISLADDSVLERLNSVLEPARTIVLAERGGDDLEHPTIRAIDDFKLVATMNPGGDYGKKELSPALRNRFTEIWVPPVDDRSDLELIVGSLWKYDVLKPYTTRLLDFTEWLCIRVADHNLLSLRDILGWVTFSNAAYRPDDGEHMRADEIFHHAAHMTFLDGLGSLPHLAAYSSDALRRLRRDALLKLQEIVPFDASLAHDPTYDPAKYIQLGSFAIARGPREPRLHSFNLQAPTTRDNAMRVIRACQLPKPILLEGSPGVGKTSLITALASIAGHNLCRINLSDQTDLIDLFGSDLPVEGGGPGEFAWKDAEFLKALQEGHWVLLDEMNLAPQAVLEGLNAVLDHRGTVYIPELGRSFTRHSGFRIFAAQNPLNQGGGRKGLPKSFVNRFTKVYIDELSPNDLLLVCRHVFPDSDADILQAMISFNTRLNEEISLKRTFARDGGPWEFNLRDVLRWGTLLTTSCPPQHPIQHLRSVYLHRFRTISDRNYACMLFEKVFSMSTAHIDRIPHPSISPSHFQVGHFHMPRRNLAPLARPGRILKTQLSALEAAGHCVSQSWLAILTGPRDSGKTELVRVLANHTGNLLHEISVNSATDTMDILGSFEQVDNRGRVLGLLEQVLSLVDRHLQSKQGSAIRRSMTHDILRKDLFATMTSSSLASMLSRASSLLGELDPSGESATSQGIKAKIDDPTTLHDVAGRFEWVDGPLVRAIKQGHWLLMDGANLCNPSVLDRLNSLCEPNGVLTLSERGYVDGKVQVVKPHPNFRLFMSVDPQHGELSRAMRNRGIEIALFTDPLSDDETILEDYLRLPKSISRGGDLNTQCVNFDAARRGMIVQEVRGSATITSSGRTLDQDSALSALIDQGPMVVISSSTTTGVTDDLLSFLVRTVAPAYISHLRRLLTALDAQPVLRFGRIQALLQVFPTHHFSTTMARIRDIFSRSRGVSPSFVFAQPMDFYMNCVPSIDSKLDWGVLSTHRVILQALDLAVALFVDQEEDSESGRIPMVNMRLQNVDGNQRALDEIARVLAAAQAAGQAISESLDAENWLEKSRDLELISQILGYTRYLRRAAGNVCFDYSAVQAISRWIADALEECPEPLMQLSSHARTLKEIVSLSSGLGLLEIWSALLINLPPMSSPAELRELEALACNLDDANTYGLRRQTFELMTLRTLPSPENQDTTAFEVLNQQVKTRLLESRLDGEVKFSCRDEPSALIAELGVLSVCCAVDDTRITGAPIRSIKEVIELACQDKHSSLLRLVSYQHMLWAVDAEKATVPIIAQLQMQWFEALWTTRSWENMPTGPSILFHPTELHATMSICDWDRSSLLSLKDYEANIRRHVRFAFLHCEDNIPRTRQLAAVLQHSISMISSCFASSFDKSVLDMIHNLSNTSSQGEPSSMLQLLSLLEQTNNVALGRALRRFLRPAFQRLGNQPQSRQRGVATLGLCWISVSRLTIDLYVPDAPIDPAAIQNCATEFWRQEAATISAQVNLHLLLEELTAGNCDNAIIDFLKARLDVIANRLSSAPMLPIRRDITRLNMFWSEVSQFQSHIISTAKIDGLLLLLESGDETAVMREQVVQQSIAGFCQRLDIVYPEYKDISAPLQLALHQMRLGLHLLAHSPACGSDHISDPVARVSTALVAFPSVRGSAMLRAESTTTGPSGVTAFRHLLLNLSAIAMERSIGVSMESQILLLEQAYEQALRLWLIDRAKEVETNEASQSLYRRKAVDYDAVGEAELEEQEFLALFPSFEDVLEQESHLHAESKPQSSVLVDPIEMQQLVDIHHSLLTTCYTLDSSSAAFTTFGDVRKSALGALLQLQVTSLPDVLDNEGLAFQLALLHRRLSSLQGTPEYAARPYNFYNDANVPEAKKALTVLEALKARLELLIQEWPDQMVLQDLRGRCDVVLNLDLHSPVAKILSSLEQLLMQSADWEIYANRGNTLKAHQQALTGLIVDWRRLELSCWQVLLEHQAKIFADGASEWWFRLYEATVRGPLDASDHEQSEGSEALTEYLKTLVPLLDDFVRSSPLGQFHARMRLLQSFQVYSTQLAPSLKGPRRLALERVQRVLHTTENYFALFSTQISTYLSEQRTALEKEIQGFIKLASWKDINVHALKQSARRTHHQLYKVIRKFRDVMRQPIMERLHPLLAGEAECKTLQANSIANHTPLSLPKTPSFPDSEPAISPSPHLANLNRTFAKFDTLVNSQIRVSIVSHSAQTVDDLAVEIITTAKTLATVSIPSSHPAEKREKQEKALLVRKRKAWSDLLKELKRAGFAVNVRPDVLARQRDARWIREQLAIPPAIKSSMSVGCENYFNRLHGALPELRTSLSDHHSDLTTRELQRGVMLLESGFTMALDARSRLATAVLSYHKVERMSRRLKMLASSNRILLSGSDLSESVTIIKDTLCRLASALDEVTLSLHTFNSLQPEPSVPIAFEERTKNLAISTKSLFTRLNTAVDDIKLTPFSVLLESEHALVCEVLWHFTQTSTTLRQWGEEQPRLRHIFHPVQSWLDYQKMPAISPEPESAPIGGSTDSVIDALLINVQTMLIKCRTSQNEDQEEERDHYIRDNYHAVRDLTHSLNTEVVFEHLESALRQLATCGQRSLRNNIERFLPFLDIYMNLIEVQLTIHGQWTRALLKLDFVLCSVMSTVARQGFCRPPDNGESGSGEDASETMEGVGLGEGSGTENVSKDIEDESQVEGLQGDDAEGSDPKENLGDDNAIEMGEDFGGDMEDVLDTHSQDENGSDQESEADPEEQLGKLDASDPSAVDEKIWGDEQGPQDPSEAEEKTDHDHSEEKGANLDIVAKEGRQPQPKDKAGEKEAGEDAHNEPEEESAIEDTGENGDTEEQSDANGAPMDDYVQDASTLDLPEDMDLGQDMHEDTSTEKDDQLEDDQLEDDRPEPSADAPDDEQPNDGPSDPDAQELTEDSQETEDPRQPREGEQNDISEEDISDQHVVAQPDVSAGDGFFAPNETHNLDSGENASVGQVGSTEGTAGQDAAVQEKGIEKKGVPESSHPQTESQNVDSQTAGAAAEGSQQGQTPSQPDIQSPSNPLRSLGDALKEMRRRFDEILDGGQNDIPREHPENTAESTQVEYLHPEDADHDIQALGPAGDEQAAKLNELKLVDDDQQDGEAATPMDIDLPSEPEHHQPPSQNLSFQAEPTSTNSRADIEDATTHSASDHSSLTFELSGPQADVEMEDLEVHHVEAELRQWQSSGLLDEGAEHIWRLYESLTHDLAYALCEQLRLILEPTLATRLKGDYRTGKRLNMKKIISYIASDYTKDKIWLRRTRPSQREYQVLIALDDSRSMAESHSVHLAYETLALVSKALSRLEAGDIAIAKFGEAVDILHGFDEGPFTDQAGTKVMNAFRFDQKATNVLSLVDRSLEVLESARERRSMSSTSAADLWQLEIIISDGICQDHDQLRTVLRRAEEQRVMIVFIIIDSLHSATDLIRTTDTSPSVQGSALNSILSMDKAAFKSVNGRMELQLERYLDSFPFEYYVVLRNVEALPDVLSGTLKQFFERISEE